MILGVQRLIFLFLGFISHKISKIDLPHITLILGVVFTIALVVKEAIILRGFS
jgi:hypothetical protein